MHGLRYKSAYTQGEEGQEKGSRQSRMVVAPGCGVATVGQRQAGASSSDPRAMGTKSYSTLN